MTQSDGIREVFADVWRAPDAHVASGRFPGYVGAVRIGGRVATRAVGTTAVESDSPSMTEDTLFRIASITKLIGGRADALPGRGQRGRARRSGGSLASGDGHIARAHYSRCHPRRDGRGPAAAHNSAAVELHVWPGRSPRANSTPGRDDGARPLSRSHSTTLLRRRVRAQDGRAAARVSARRGWNGGTGTTAYVDPAATRWASSSHSGR